MERDRNAFLELIRVGVTDECLVSTTVFDADWKKVYNFACTQGTTSIAWHGIEILYKYSINKCPQDVKLQWYAKSQQVETANKKMFGNIIAFADAVAPLKLAVLKGSDYAQYWNNPLWREFGDLDCAVVDESLELRAENSKLLDEKTAESGFRIDDGGYKHSHIHYGDLMVENHYSFTDFAGSKCGKRLEKELRKLFNGKFKNIKDTVLLSPNVNFTAVYMIAHAQAHFFYEGINFRQILDWHFFLIKESRNVDWLTVKPILEKTGLKAFAILLTQICNKYFDLQSDIFATELACNDELVTKFLDDVFAEKYNDNDRRWWKIIERITHRYGRFIKFRKLNKISVSSAIWRTLAYSSFLHRKPEL